MQKCTQILNWIILSFVKVANGNVSLFLSHAAYQSPPSSSFSFFSKAISISLSFSFA